MAFAKPIFILQARERGPQQWPRLAPILAQLTSESPWKKISVFVTNLGDAAVTVPLALMTCCFLLVVCETRLAFGWLAAILGAAVGIGVLKLLLASCGHPLATVGLLSPSGHTAMSVAVYGSLSLLIADRLCSLLRNTIYLGGGLLVSGIAAWRRALGHHTLAEVALGLGVGLGAAAGFRTILAKARAVFAGPMASRRHDHFDCFATRGRVAG